jgi:DNA-directed RNA polymerase specialized sigma24 family protein
MLRDPTPTLGTSRGFSGERMRLSSSNPIDARRWARDERASALAPSRIASYLSGVPGEPSAVEHRAAIDAELKKLKDDDWRRLRKQLVGFAVYRCKNKELAEELVQRAMEKLLDPRRSSWVPAKEPVLARHLMSLVNTAYANERTSARARRDVPLDDDPNDEDELRDERAFSEDRAAEMDMNARRLKMLCARFEGEEIPAKLLGHMLDGLETPAALATAMRMTVDEVVVVRRRILRHAADIAHELRGGDDDDADDDDDRDDEDEGGA